MAFKANHALSLDFLGQTDFTKHATLGIPETIKRQLEPVNCPAIRSSRHSLEVPAATARIRAERGILGQYRGELQVDRSRQ